jgi:predicted membrane protein
MELKGQAVTPQLVFGGLVMLLGIALLLDRMGIVDAGFVFRLWPLALVAFGAMHFTRGERQHRFWGVFWVFTGCWLLLRSLGIVYIGFWELLVPILLTAFGASMVMRTLMESGHVRPERGRALQLFAVLGGRKQRVDGQPFEGAYLTAFMGGCELDLRRATMQPGEQQSIEVFAMMGGHEIRVPPEWNVSLEVTPILGGVEDKRLPAVTPPPLDGSRPRLVVRGTVIMGGVELKD